MEVGGRLLDIQLRFPPALFHNRPRGSALRQWFVPAASCQTISDVIEQIKVEFELEHEHLVLVRNQARFRASLPATILRPDDVIYVEKVVGIAVPGTPGCAVCGCSDETKFSTRQLKSPFGLSSGKARCQGCISAGLQVGGSVSSGDTDSLEGAARKKAASFSIDLVSMADTLESAQLKCDAEEEDSVLRELSEAQDGSVLEVEEDEKEKKDEDDESLESSQLGWDAEEEDSVLRELSEAQDCSVLDDDDDEESSVGSVESAKSMALKVASRAKAVKVIKKFGDMDLGGQPLQIKIVEDVDRGSDDYFHDGEITSHHGLLRISNLSKEVTCQQVCDIIDPVVSVLLAWTIVDMETTSDSSLKSSKSMAVELSSHAEADVVVCRFGRVELAGRPMDIQAIKPEERDADLYGDVPWEHGLVRISNVPLTCTSEIMKGTISQVATVELAWDVSGFGSEEEEEASEKRG